MVAEIWTYSFVDQLVALNWKSHIDKLSVKCCRILGILNRLNRILPLNINIILYNSLMLPHLNYGITLWGFKCERILKLQKKSCSNIKC